MAGCLFTGYSGEGNLLLKYLSRLKETVSVLGLLDFVLFGAKGRIGYAKVVSCGNCCFMPSLELYVPLYTNLLICFPSLLLLLVIIVFLC